MSVVMRHNPLTETDSASSFYFFFLLLTLNGGHVHCECVGDVRRVEAVGSKVLHKEKKYILVSEEKHGHRSTDFYSSYSFLCSLRCRCCRLFKSNKGGWDVGSMWEGIVVETKGLTKGMRLKLR